MSKWFIETQPKTYNKFKNIFNLVYFLVFMDFSTNYKFANAIRVTSPPPAAAAPPPPTTLYVAKNNTTHRGKTCHHICHMLSWGINLAVSFILCSMVVCSTFVFGEGGRPSAAAETNGIQIPVSATHHMTKHHHSHHATRHTPKFVSIWFKIRSVQWHGLPSTITRQFIAPQWSFFVSDKKVGWMDGCMAGWLVCCLAVV